MNPSPIPPASASLSAPSTQQALQHVIQAALKRLQPLSLDELIGLEKKMPPEQWHPENLKLLLCDPASQSGSELDSVCDSFLLGMQAESPGIRSDPMTPARRRFLDANTVPALDSAQKNNLIELLSARERSNAMLADAGLTLTGSDEDISQIVQDNAAIVSLLKFGRTAMAPRMLLLIRKTVSEYRAILQLLEKAKPGTFKYTDALMFKAGDKNSLRRFAARTDSIFFDACLHNFPLAQAIAEREGALKTIINRPGIAGLPILSELCRNAGKLSTAVGEVPWIEHIYQVIEWGADLKATPDPAKVIRYGNRLQQGQTALHLLAQNTSGNQTDIARLLLAKGANIDAKDAFGLTPLLAINARSYDYHPASGNSIALAMMLIRKGCSIAGRDHKGRTLLHSLFPTGEELPRLVISKLSPREIESYINAKDDEGHTPLSDALFSDNLPMIKILLEAGAKTELATLRAERTDIAALEKKLSALEKKHSPPGAVGKTEGGQAGRSSVRNNIDQANLRSILQKKKEILKRLQAAMNKSRQKKSMASGKSFKSITKPNS